MLLTEDANVTTFANVNIADLRDDQVIFRYTVAHPDEPLKLTTVSNLTKSRHRRDKHHIPGASPTPLILGRESTLYCTQQHAIDRNSLVYVYV